MLRLIFQTSDVVACNNNEEVTAQPMVDEKKQKSSKDQRRAHWRRFAQNLNRLLFISYIITEVVLVAAYVQITS